MRQVLVSNDYNKKVRKEMQEWQKSMQRRPNLINKTTKGIQNRINRVIPEKIHKIITKAIRQMIRAVLYGANVTTPAVPVEFSLEQMDYLTRERIKFYRSGAAVEGAITGVGGILWGLSDFPLWLSIKMKMLFEIAARYGYNVNDYKERIFILNVFQLTFSSRQNRRKVYEIIANWDKEKELLPDDIDEFDWRTFQLEYRDYIDLAKLFQMIPGVGAVVGAIVNHRLTNRLGVNAMNAYRMRLLE